MEQCVKYFKYLVLCFYPEKCFECLRSDNYISSENWGDGNGILEGKEVRCTNCQTVQGTWSYGAWDDPWPYMKTFTQRFSYLFFGKIK